MPRRKGKRSGSTRDRKVVRSGQERRSLWSHAIDIDVPPVRVSSHHLLHWWALKNTSIHAFFPFEVFSCSQRKMNSLSVIFLFPFLSLMSQPKHCLCRKFERSSSGWLSRGLDPFWKNLNNNYGVLRTFVFVYALFFPFLLLLFSLSFFLLSYFFYFLAFLFPRLLLLYLKVGQKRW